MRGRELHIDSHMTYGDLRRYAATLDVTICSELLAPGINGFYSEAVRTIIIDRSMSYTQKRCTLVHELTHWSHGDCRCVGIMHERCENRARRETAMTLIPVSDYALLEREYEGEPFQIAMELDVTKQIIDDYRALAIPRMALS